MRSLGLVASSFWNLMRENRWMALLWGSCLIGGTTAGVALLWEHYGLVRSVVGGCLGGTGAAIILSINRLID